MMTLMMTQMHLDDDRDDDPEDNPYDHSPFSVPISVYSACHLLPSGTCKIDSKPSVTRLSSTCLIRTTTYENQDDNNNGESADRLFEKRDLSAAGFVRSIPVTWSTTWASPKIVICFAHPNSTVTKFCILFSLSFFNFHQQLQKYTHCTCILPSRQKYAGVWLHIQNLGMGTTFGDLPIKGSLYCQLATIKICVKTINQQPNI